LAAFSQENFSTTASPSQTFESLPGIAGGLPHLVTSSSGEKVPLVPPEEKVSDILSVTGEIEKPITMNQKEEYRLKNGKYPVLLSIVSPGKQSSYKFNLIIDSSTEYQDFRRK
jgi:hypothetical protein